MKYLEHLLPRLSITFNAIPNDSHHNVELFTANRRKK